jgi:hypothetical protein
MTRRLSACDDTRLLRDRILTADAVNAVHHIQKVATQARPISSRTRCSRDERGNSTSNGIGRICAVARGADPWSGDCCIGNAGQDLLNQGQGFTLDLSTMVLQLR